MAEFVEVTEQLQRMCTGCNPDVSECEILRLRGYSSCLNYIVEHPKEAEEIIMKWVKEHPAKTNADKFKEVFGIENVKRCVVKDTEECK